MDPDSTNAHCEHNELFTNDEIVANFKARGSVPHAGARSAMLRPITYIHIYIHMYTFVHILMCMFVCVRPAVTTLLSAKFSPFSNSFLTKNF